MPEIGKEGAKIGSPCTAKAMNSIRRLHTMSAAIIGAYAAMHIMNHLTAVFGVAQHIAFMEAARIVYRARIVEVVLLSSVTVQVVSGIWLVVNRWRERHGVVTWLQAAAGAYLAIFLIIHVGAVLFGRTVLHLDTNFFYAAAGFYVSPYQFFFAPYYFLAVVALFTHLGCAAYWLLATPGEPRRISFIVVSAAAGVAVSTVIVLSLAGVFHPVHVPAKYLDTYR